MSQTPTALSPLEDLVAHVATDPELRHRLAEHPQDVLRDAGVEIDDRPIRVLEIPLAPVVDRAHLPIVDGEQVLVLPYVDGGLDEAVLEDATGGGFVDALRATAGFVFSMGYRSTIQGSLEDAARSR